MTVHAPVVGVGMFKYDEVPEKGVEIVCVRDASALPEYQIFAPLPETVWFDNAAADTSSFTPVGRFVGVKGVIGLKKHPKPNISPKRANINARVSGIFFR